MTSRRYSHSALKTAQRCLKQWSYKYIDRLEPVVSKPHLEKGSELHALLEQYYRDEWFSGNYGSDDNTEIIQRYLHHYAKDDWEILHIEEEFEMIVNGYTLVFIPDLVVRINGEVWIVDHKTTVRIPDEWDLYNMGDFQHLLYLEGMEQNGYDEVAGFIFNYIRTKPPTMPKLRKDGKIADIRRLDTDYNTLLMFAEEHGLEKDPDVEEKLAILAHTPNKFFQRHHILYNEHAVAQAVHDTAQALTFLEEAEIESMYPRHVISGGGGYMSCAKCDYQPLCHTEMLGMNVDLEVLGYRERERRNNDNAEPSDERQ